MLLQLGGGGCERGEGVTQRERGEGRAHERGWKECAGECVGRSVKPSPHGRYRRSS